ncbi:nucleoside phosphorylase [Lacticaseibacillus absianus]|uniref:nucleoside phosphorylase n=1 Tax=Lacticaseibacillus absianus TaxID=2729623 RepID=UPI0015C77F95|nr:nucleoside phosphorylase [Lacticaseibacillus absianus]
MTLPLLTYDGTPRAVLDPFRDEGFTFPAKMLYAFITPENVATFVARYPHKVVGEFVTVSNHFEVYALTVGDQQIGLCRAPLGAPAATQLLDFLIAYGAKQIIAVGSCGVLVETPENQLMVATRALRDEGTSFHYLPAAATVALDETLTTHLMTVLGTAVRPVQTWTTDGYFRETEQKIAASLAAGCEVVEMECAALAACAEFRAVQFAQLLFTADSLAAVAAYDARDFGVASHLRVLAAGLDCLAQLA